MRGCTAGALPSARGCRIYTWRALALVCALVVGVADEAADAEQPAVVLRLANALQRSTEYGQYDDEFLKSNIAEVHAGYYQMYYSPRVYTELPELVTITLDVEVSGYDMGALKDFASARPCVRVQLPQANQDEGAVEKGDAEFCGHRTFSFSWQGQRSLHEPRLFHAALYDRNMHWVADSETIAVEFVELPTWRPPLLELPRAHPQMRSPPDTEMSKDVLERPPESKEGHLHLSHGQQASGTSELPGGQAGDKDDCSPENQSGSGAGQGAYGDRAVVTFLADEADVGTFLARLQNWHENLGKPCAPQASAPADQASAPANDFASCCRNTDAHGGGDAHNDGDIGSDSGGGRRISWDR